MDLNIQTLQNYDKYENKAAINTEQTSDLEKFFDGTKGEGQIVITTIQKLYRCAQSISVSEDRLLIIFDECHRTQHREMHTKIRKTFKNSIVIGFTGTPIFSDKEQTLNKEDSSKSKDKKVSKITSSDRFGDELHAYNLFNKCTFRSTIQAENIEEKRKRGYNSMFAVSSIELAKAYYIELERQVKNRGIDVKIAIVYHPLDRQKISAEGVKEYSQKKDSNIDALPESDKLFLERAMKKYDPGASLSRFHEYFQKIQNDTRNRKIDILIVVNMLLTGFDAPNLSTL
ncbi:hypothetical protein PVNG_02337 [Plasmodium vivax North Korean]|uniref:Helicase ATP-binding domain-containing protein n=1 Tax=Plasmodium vivax North Korean TaxID=1035514 RepID=A0A0J9TLK7_PLAVI|nr:hypothetical protein PVNG_02337 [Plasmodium vivax North Korean]